MGNRLPRVDHATPKPPMTLRKNHLDGLSVSRLRAGCLFWRFRQVPVNRKPTGLSVTERSE